MTQRALKTEEEIAGIPLDKPVLIELPDGIEVETEVEVKKPQSEDDGGKRLQEQLDAALAAQKATEERERVAAERAVKAEREADKARKDADEFRKRTVALEGDVISGGLQSAQNELVAAEAELARAGEAADWQAMAKAQARIGRASAQIVSLESGAAEVAERKEVRPEPVRQVTQSFAEQVRSNPNLMNAEQDWMLKHEAAFKDSDFNRKLEFAYQGAINKGVVRGSPDYFDFIEKATGLKASEEREVDVQAPVTRQERNSDGRSGSKITLSPEQREMAKLMGVSELDYAKQVLNFEAARKLEPQKYGDRA